MKKWTVLLALLAFSFNPHAYARSFVCGFFPNDAILPEEIQVGHAYPDPDVSVLEIDGIRVEIRTPVGRLSAQAWVGPIKIGSVEIPNWKPSETFQILSIRCAAETIGAADAYIMLQGLKYYNAEVSRKVRELEDQGFRMAFGEVLNRPSGKSKVVLGKNGDRFEEIEQDFYRVNENGLLQRATLKVRVKSKIVKASTGKAYRPPAPKIESFDIVIVDLPEHGGTNTSGGR